MKSFIAVTILTIAVNALCIWDVWHTKQVFKHMNKESSAIHYELLNNDITSPELANRITELDKYWTKKWIYYVYPLAEKTYNQLATIYNF